MLCIGLKNAETSVNTYWGRQKWKVLNEETSRRAKCSIVMTSSNYSNEKVTGNKAKVEGSERRDVEKSEMQYCDDIIKLLK